MSSRIWRYLIVLVIIGVTLSFAIPTYAADELREYLNTGGDGDSQYIYSGNWTAQQFTSDNVSHKVSSVRLSLKRVGNPGTVTVSIKEADGAHKPTGADLSSGTIDGDTFGTSYSFITVDLDEVSLEGATEYTIVVRAIAGDVANYVLWQDDSGGGLANAVGLSSNDGGVTWSSDSPADYLFEIWGDECLVINGAGVFSGYIEDDDLLITIDYLAEYPPYYPSDDSAEHFDVQLCSADNVTDVIASTPMVDWGYKPASIYLSADLAAGITFGDSYYIKLLNADSPSTVNETYQLQSTDWYGDDLTYLDRWCIRLAHNMESYYSLTFVTYVSGKGEVLNEQGGILFDAGINGLSYVRPDLFKTTVNNPQYELPTYTNAYENATDWETEVGATIAATMTDLGDLIGMDGRGFLGLLFGLSIIALPLLTRSFLFGTLLSIPVAFWGTELRVIPIAIVAIIAAIAAFAVIGKLIWSRM